MKLTSIIEKSLTDKSPLKSHESFTIGQHQLMPIVIYKLI